MTEIDMTDVPTTTLSAAALPVRQLTGDQALARWVREAGDPTLKAAVRKVFPEATTNRSVAAFSAGFRAGYEQALIEADIPEAS